jgi:hypothetical protein
MLDCCLPCEKSLIEQANIGEDAYFTTTSSSILLAQMTLPT